MVPNVSFNEEWWSKQPLDDFIYHALKFGWSELDATVYHAKIRKDQGLEVSKPIVKTAKNDTKPDAPKVAAEPKQPDAGGNGNNTGE